MPPGTVFWKQFITIQFQIPIENLHAVLVNMKKILPNHHSEATHRNGAVTFSLVGHRNMDSQRNNTETSERIRNVVISKAIHENILRNICS